MTRTITRNLRARIRRVRRKGIILDDDNGQYMKVRRGGDNPSPGFDVGLTFFRGYAIKDNYFPDGTTVRCAVNAAEAVK